MVLSRFPSRRVMRLRLITRPKAAEISKSTRARYSKYSGSVRMQIVSSVEQADGVRGRGRSARVGGKFQVVPPASALPIWHSTRHYGLRHPTSANAVSVRRSDGRSYWNVRTTGRRCGYAERVTPFALSSTRAGVWRRNNACRRLRAP